MLTTLTLALAACVHRPVTDARLPVAAEAIAVERLSDASYRLSWQPTRPGAKVDVLVAAISGADAATRLVARQVQGDAVVVTVPVTPRPYFLLRSRGATDVWVAERVLPLAGGQNFRDLGGYRTHDGRQVRWGVLFRSGSMADLTSDDQHYLGTLGIRVLCDLRSPPERQAEPTAWQAFGVHEYLSWDYRLDMSGIGAALQDRTITGEKMVAAMTQFYRAVPREFAPRYREMFARLDAGEIPLAMNCSAGKDRTGIGSALLLLALDVPRETVVADYLLSKQTYDPARARQSAALQRILGQLPAEVGDALTGVRAEYLEAALAQMAADYGSVEGYLENALGVTPAVRERLRARLVQ